MTRGALTFFMRLCLISNEMVMPWVRLHATKDYYDMPAKLNNYPQTHQTFNLVPSLLKQLKAYESGEVTDEYWELSLKPVSQASGFSSGDLINPPRRFPCCTLYRKRSSPSILSASCDLWRARNFPIRL